LQRLGPGVFTGLLPEGAELWLDGGHNPAAGRALSASVSELNERVSRPLVLIWGMLNSKVAQGFIAPFRGLAHGVVTVTIPGEENALPAEALAEAATASGLKAEAASSLEDAVARAGGLAEAPRVLICGSLYLAGQVLAAHHGETGSAVSGASRR
jgi:dihydrofolate synthase / folylpolyglutamate synthase